MSRFQTAYPGQDLTFRPSIFALFESSCRGMCIFCEPGYNASELTDEQALAVEDCPDLPVSPTQPR